VKFYTYRAVALAHKHVWQKIRFTKGKGYWLFGKPPRPAGDVTMYDSVNVAQIPADAAAVAGYVNGHWPTYPFVVKQFPHALHLSVAVTAHADADCLDVEQGDATNDQAAAWVTRQKARGNTRPVVYTSVSNAPALTRALARGGIGRTGFRLWTAHYTFVPHRCTAACWAGFNGQADATQYTNHALGRNLDASVCAPSFFTPQV
jgi:hypothetical protein